MSRPSSCAFARRDGDDAVLERVRRVRRVELQVELGRRRAPTARRGASDERRETGREPRLGGRRRRAAAARSARSTAGRLRSTRGSRRRAGRPSRRRGRAGRSSAGRRRRLEAVLGLADTAAEGNRGHWPLLRLARHPPGLLPGRDWHLARRLGRLPRLRRAGSLSLSRCGAGRARSHRVYSRTK